MKMWEDRDEDHGFVRAPIRCFIADRQSNIVVGSDRGLWGLFAVLWSSEVVLCMIYDLTYWWFSPLSLSRCGRFLFALGKWVSRKCMLSVPSSEAKLLMRGGSYFWKWKASWKHSLTSATSCRIHPSSISMQYNRKIWRVSNSFGAWEKELEHWRLVFLRCWLLFQENSLSFTIVHGQGKVKEIDRIRSYILGTCWCRSRGT